MTRLGQTRLRRDTRTEPFAEHYISRVRWRLTLRYGLIMGALLLAVILTIYLSLWEQETQLVRSQLVAKAREKQQLPSIAAILKQTPELKDEEEAVRTFVLSPDGVLREADAVRKQAPDPKAVRRVLHGGGPNFSRSLLPTSNLAVYTAPIVRHGARLGAVQTVTSVGPYTAFLRELLVISFGVGVPALLVAGLAAFFMARRALGPIRAAARTQQAFAQNAAHELRAPLTVLRTAADLALIAQEPAEMREALEISVRQTDHLKALIGDVEALARADAGYAALANQPVNLADLLRSVGQEVGSLATANDIHLAIDVESHAWVRGDIRRLRQLFLILLDNAVKYTPRGGKIDIALTMQRRQVSISVRDTGPGIPIDHLPHIFERFYRVDRARSPGAGGTGLGLAIAREITQAHGGRITVESTVSSGTTFRLMLPTQPGLYPPSD